MNLRKEEEQRGKEERRETRAQCELGMEFNRQKTRLYLYSLQGVRSGTVWINKDPMPRVSVRAFTPTCTDITEVKELVPPR